MADPARPAQSQGACHTLLLYGHNSRSQSLIEKRLQQIGEAHEVTDDSALIEPLVLAGGIT
jgi:hypothetical protein